MTSRRIPLMTPAGRDAREISREELEELIIEQDEEITRRTKRITELKRILTQVNTSAQRTETAAQDQVLDYIIPPSCLRGDYAKNYAGKDAHEYVQEKNLTHPDGTPYAKKETRVAGSFNPYSGANRKIVSLRQKIGDLQQQINDLHSEQAKLRKEKEKLRLKLEDRDAPGANPWKHEKPIPKTKPKKKVVTIRQCIKRLEELIDAEKDPDRKEYYRCCWLLLSGHDREALELFSILYDPNLTQDSIKELQDLLDDRNAQIAILKAQFDHLDAKHKTMRDAFTSLKEKMVDHLIDNNADIAELKAQIAELEKQIGEIPGVEEKIKQLEGELSSLRKQREDITTAGYEKVAQMQAEIDEKLNEISAKKAEAMRVQQELKENNERLKTRYETLSYETGNLQSENEKIRQILEQINRRNADVHAKLELLEKAGCRSPDQVRAVATFCNGPSPQDLVRQREALLEEYHRKKSRYDDARKKCQRLQATIQYNAGAMESSRLSAQSSGFSSVREFPSDASA